MMDYGLGGWNSISYRDKIFFFSSQGPDQVWGLTSLLSNEYSELIVQRWSDHTPPSSAKIKKG
jgi:hypothetical protein